MGKITTVGIDLAKNVFSVHAVDERGAVVLRKTVSRARLLPLIAQWPACLIGMEACSGAHEWARRMQVFGHTVRIMAARFVTPYRRSGKNDGNDAEAICGAVQRPAMRFVPVKSAEQQAVLSHVKQVRPTFGKPDQLWGLRHKPTNDRGPNVRLAFGPGAKSCSLHKAVYRPAARPRFIA